MYLKRETGTRRGLYLAALAALGATLAAATPASAITQKTITGIDGDRQARAFFDIQGSNLVVTLSNISLSDAMVPVDILTGVYFDIAAPAGVSFTKSSAVLGAGAVVYKGNDPNLAVPGGNVGDQWAFRGGSDFFNTYDYGVSASGLGLFGPGDLFGGPDLTGFEGDSPGPGGLAYGITTAGDDKTTFNGGLNRAVVKNSVVFTLGITNPNGSLIDLDQISKVRFQYGTSLTEPSITIIPPPSITPVPEPGAVAFGVIMGGGLLGMIACGRRRRMAA